MINTFFKFNDEAETVIKISLINCFYYADDAEISVKYFNGESEHEESLNYKNKKEATEDYERLLNELEFVNTPTAKEKRTRRLSEKELYLKDKRQAFKELNL